MKQIEEKLVKLFDELVEDFRRLIKDGDCTAADRKVIIELLKQNGISIEVKKGTPMSFLVEELPFETDHYSSH